MATQSMDPPDTDLINFAVRMVIPMRREFGLNLDVPHFMHDFVYAREVLDQAKTSEDARLREYAAYLETGLFGPRNRPRPGAVVAPASGTAPPTSGTSAKDSSAEEHVARVLNKYKGGVR